MMEKDTLRPCEKIIFTPFIHAFGGVERLILAVSRHLHERGCAHRIVCFEETIDYASYAGWPLKVQELRPARNSLSEAWALQRYLNAAQVRGAAPALLFDLKAAFYVGLFSSPWFFLHLTDPPSLLPRDASKNAASARRAYAPFAVASKPTTVKMAHAEMVHRINRRGVRRATKVVAMTNSIAAELNWLYGVKPTIIRPGVAMSKAQSRRIVGGDKARILSVCRLEANKRIDWILRALHELEVTTPPLRQRIGWTLHIVGEGSQEKPLKSLARSLKLQEKVVFHGRVSDIELEQIYAAADLFLMPAVQGYGLPALESLARGIPVILHRESGVSEILSNTPWAEIIEEDVQSLAQAVNIMIDRLQSNVFQKHPVPAIPTESDWADNISKLCGWLPV